jgi:hypothetical protein
VLGLVSARLWGKNRCAGAVPEPQEQDEMGADTKANLDNAKKAVGDLDKEFNKNQPKIADVLSGLEGAIAKKDGTMLDLYAGRIDATSGLIADTLRDTKDALAALAVLRKDEEFMATKFEVVKALTEKVDGSKTKLTQQLVKLKDLQKQALQLMDKLQGGQDDAVAKYAELEDKVNDKKTDIERKYKQHQALVAAADKAFAAKNQKALTDARTKIIGMFSGDSIILMTLDKDIKTFLVKYKSAGLNTDANWLKDEVYKMQSILEESEADMKRLMALRQIQAAKEEAPEPPKPTLLSNAEIAKVGTALGIDAKDNAKLGKMLNTVSRDKWKDELGKLAKTLGWQETDPKILYQKVLKVDAIKKQVLIDI